MKTIVELGKTFYIVPTLSVYQDNPTIKIGGICPGDFDKPSTWEFYAYCYSRKTSIYAGNYLSKEQAARDLARWWLVTGEKQWRRELRSKELLTQEDWHDKYFYYPPKRRKTLRLRRIISSCIFAGVSYITVSFPSIAGLLGLFGAAAILLILWER